MDGNKAQYKCLNEDTSYDTVTIKDDPEQAQHDTLVPGMVELSWAPPR